MIGKPVEGWHWQWKGKFLRLWSPSSRVAVVVSFNERLGWLWSQRESPMHRVPDQVAAVRDALAALKMENRVRAQLLAIVLEEFERLRKINNANDGEFPDDDGEKEH